VASRPADSNQFPTKQLTHDSNRLKSMFISFRHVDAPPRFARRAALSAYAAHTRKPDVIHVDVYINKEREREKERDRYLLYYIKKI